MRYIMHHEWNIQFLYRHFEWYIQFLQLIVLSIELLFWIQVIEVLMLLEGCGLTFVCFRGLVSPEMRLLVALQVQGLVRLLRLYRIHKLFWLIQMRQIFRCLLLRCLGLGLFLHLWFCNIWLLVLILLS